ncbi:MAG: cytidine deaminase, partial [Pyrobaculum sp.]
MDLVEKAREILKNAYAPYSGFRVAALVLTKNGKVYTGVNIE